MKTILVIDDSIYIRQTLAELLELAGYAVRTAENGKIGVERALASPPDLVVCDVMMPILDGHGVLAYFTQVPQLARIPFIFLTAQTSRADWRRGLALGAGAYLAKPFGEDELMRAIAGCLAGATPVAARPALVLCETSRQDELPPAFKGPLPGSFTSCLTSPQDSRVRPHPIFCRCP